MTLHIMSDKELARVEVLRDLMSGRLTVSTAAELLGLERRQVQRLAKAYQTQGATALTSKKRGKPSNRQMPESLKAQTLVVIRERYADFGPTLAAEKLREVHGITIGRETLRLWMREAGLWADRQKRRGRVYQPRYRRECVGELIQVDGSEHWWFEERGPQCTLLVFIDDATSRLMHLQFVQSESTFAYFNATQWYLEQHGKPIAFYTDKHAVFRVNKAAGLHGDGMTQFGRALKALTIEIICANSSQAKGRVERANKTPQDRLVKELRLAGISTMEAGNAFVPTFMADYNGRFAKAPFNDKDLHRPMTPRDFHFTIARASKNASNIFILEQLWQMRSEVPEVKRVYSAVCKGDSGHRVAEHTEILEALQRRSPSDARQAMRNHFSRLLEALLTAAEVEAIEDIRVRSLQDRERFLSSAHVV